MKVLRKDGEKFVYGRGAVDVKNVAFGILETLEYLAENEKQPKRTFYVAFGHDEEVGHGVVYDICLKIRKLFG